MSNYQQFRTLKSNGTSLVGRPQKGMRQPSGKLNFNEWLETGFQHFEEAGGSVESYVCNEIIFTIMTKPDESFIVRTNDEFETQYKEKYIGITKSSSYRGTGATA